MNVFLFDTAIGRCAVGWTESGICAVALPDRNDAATLRHIDGAITDPPEWVRAAIDGIVGLLAGGTDDLGWIPVDFGETAAFPRAVYEAIRSVPPGTTISYGELAKRLGEPGGAQAVGRALGANPVPIVVPCHRVLAADGRMHGFSAPGGVRTKQRILEIEGALEPTLFDL